VCSSPQNTLKSHNSTIEFAKLSARDLHRQIRAVETALNTEGRGEAEELSAGNSRLAPV